MTVTEFKSAFGWFGIIVCALACGIPMFLASMYGVSPSEFIILAMITVSIMGYILYFNFAIRYLLLDHGLKITVPMVYQKNIPYSQITKVYPSKDITASPAPSLNRVAIELQSGHRILISPRRRKEFIQELDYRRLGRA